MNDRDRAERIRIIMQRRVRGMQQDMGIPAFSRREMAEIVKRLCFALGEEGVCDADLRVAVRLFNRECAGRVREG